MSRGWDAVGAVGASLLARGQRKRDLDDERKWQTEQAELEWKRNEAKRKLDAELAQANIAAAQERAAASRASAQHSEFKMMAGTAVGEQRFFKDPNQEGILAEPIGVSASQQATIDAENARAAASRATTLEAARIRNSGHTPTRSALGTDHTAKIAEVQSKIELANGMSDNEIRIKYPGADPKAWRANQVNALTGQLETLKAAQSARDARANVGLLPSADLTDQDRAVVAAAQASGGNVPQSVAPGAKINLGPQGKAPGSSKETAIPVGWGDIDSVPDGTWITLPNGKTGQK